jgi:hypothetical protein
MGSPKKSERSSYATDGGQDLDAETRDHLAACREQLPSVLSSHTVTLGFDGFVDRGREMIDERTADSYVPVGNLRRLGERIVDSADADSSLTVEWTTTYQRTGGHTAHIGRAYDHLGLDVTLVGTFGQPVKDIYAEEYADATLVSFAEPGYTEAVEFADQKLLVSDTGPQRELDWAMLRDRVGLETLAEHIDGADMLGLGYWAIITSMPDIWDGLRTELWDRLENPPAFALVDPFNVRQLTFEELQAGRDPLAALDDTLPVTMCANKAETYHLAELFDANADALSLAEAAETVRDGFGVSEYAAHAIDGGVYAADTGSHELVSPYTETPAITTSAGDHFAAGFALGRLEKLDPRASLVVAAAVVGQFVRDGDPPGYDELTAFIEEYDTYF